MKRLVSASVLATFACYPAAGGAREIGKKEISALIEVFSNQPPKAGFHDFLNAPGLAAKYPFLSSAVRKYQSGSKLSDAERINLYRLLGIFIRLRHEDSLVRTLGGLVAIPTDKKED